MQRKPTRSHATSQNFCLKKLPWCVCHYTWVSKKNVKFFLKVVIWASKAKKWPCQAVLEIFQDMVKSLGKNLSFSSSLVNTGQHRKKLTYLGYYPTFSVSCHSDFNTLKYMNLPSKSGLITFWDVDPKFLKLKFYQN